MLVIMNDDDNNAKSIINNYYKIFTESFAHENIKIVSPRTGTDSGISDKW